MHCVVFAVAKQDWTSKQVHLPKKWAISSPKNMKEPWLLPRHGLPWLEQNSDWTFKNEKFHKIWVFKKKRQIHITRRAERRRRTFLLLLWFRSGDFDPLTTLTNTVRILTNFNRFWRIFTNWHHACSRMSESRSGLASPPKNKKFGTA